ncbi:TetR/AcrR family transcriptional regulator, partial [Mycobacterium tuberculosis]|nr:TetR/AcrR family transcriptional regulator [Mycobacterium tuberculosis]
MSHAPRKTGHPPRATEAATLSEDGPARSHVAERQEARRRQILDTAAQLFYTKGYPGMTMNDLC